MVCVCVDSWKPNECTIKKNLKLRRNQSITRIFESCTLDTARKLNEKKWFKENMKSLLFIFSYPLFSSS